MTEEPTLRGFVARLQEKSTAGGEKLSYMERKYIEAAERVARKKQ